MAFFFRGALTSSPIKKKDESFNSGLVDSLLSDSSSLLSDSTYECFSTNPLTGSLCQCRRSPRLLGNGYYVLTEDSVAVDDEGNVTLTPSKTNVSYKENLVRIFRRRRRERKSLSRLLSDVGQSCQSWLGGTVFRWSDPAPQTDPANESFDQDYDISHDYSAGQSAVYPRTPLKRSHTHNESSHTPLHQCCAPIGQGGCHTSDRQFPPTFTYDVSETLNPLDKEKCPDWFEESKAVEPNTEEVFFCQPMGGLLEVPPPIAIGQDRCHTPVDTPQGGSTLMKALLLLLLMLCIYVVFFPRWLLGGVVMAMATLLLVSFSRKDVAWRRAKTEDITSRNE